MRLDLARPLAAMVLVGTLAIPTTALAQGMRAELVSSSTQQLYQSEIRYEGGDGDQVVEPGETLSIYITLTLPDATYSYGSSGSVPGSEGEAQAGSSEPASPPDAATSEPIAEPEPVDSSIIEPVIPTAIPNQPVTGLTGTLTIEDASGVTAEDGTVAWPDIQPGGSGTNETPFVIHVADDAERTAPCGMTTIMEPETGEIVEVSPGEPDDSASSGSSTWGPTGPPGSLIPAVSSTEPGDDSVVESPIGRGDDRLPIWTPPTPGPDDPVTWQGTLRLASGDSEADVWVGNSIACALAATGAPTDGGAVMRDKTAGLESAQVAIHPLPDNRAMATAMAAVLILLAAIGAGYFSMRLRAAEKAASEGDQQA